MCQNESQFFSNKDLGISFAIPKGLNLYTPEKPGPLRQSFTQGQFLYLINPDFKGENIGAKYSAFITESDLTGFKQELEESLPTSSLPGYKKISVRYIRIGSNKQIKAVEHVYSMRGNVLETIRQILFIYKGRGFTFTCATSKLRYPKANKVFFDEIFSNIIFK